MPTRYANQDTLWYKDAIVYELHVRGFYDGDGDGIGDFRGLIEKLDYLEDLGVTAVWILPFYPSPLRDGGYDIADYTAVHPDYGTLRRLQGVPPRGASARPARHHRAGPQPHLRPAPVVPAGAPRAARLVGARLLRLERHARPLPRHADHLPGLRARRTGRGTRSPARTTGTVSISHQPDLNYDNPRSARRSSAVVDFWLEMGVDGLRLDAVPYLYEREGTNCENLPETHAFLEGCARTSTSSSRTGCCWPRRTSGPRTPSAYFGDGDECHMGFHFPLMPRLFMAMRRRTASRSSTSWTRRRRSPRRLPVGDVPAQPRRAHARDGHRRGARLHVPRLCRATGRRASISASAAGWRRCCGNDRRRIELMNALLFSLAGHADRLLRRRDRHGRQRLPRRPRRRAHADAVEPRPQRRLLAGQSAAAVPAARSSTPSTTTRRSTSRRSRPTRARCCGS